MYIFHPCILAFAFLAVAAFFFFHVLYFLLELALSREREE